MSALRQTINKEFNRVMKMIHIIFIAVGDWLCGQKSKSSIWRLSGEFKPDRPDSEDFANLAEV